MPASSTATAPVVEDVSTAKSHKKGVKDWSTSKLLRVLRFMNMFGALGLILTGTLLLLLTFSSIGFSGATTCVLIAGFGFMLCCVEVNIPNLQPVFRRNFGFLFTFGGRSVYILFIASMCASLDTLVGWAVAIVIFLIGGFNFYVMYTHPAFKTGELKKKSDPFTNYTTAGQEVTTVVRNNPELARKAGSAAIGVAANNPELRREMVRGAVETSNPFQPGGAAANNPTLDRR